MLDTKLAESLQQIDLIDENKKLALSHFLAKGFPTHRLEEWKYASLKSLNDVSWAWQTDQKIVDLGQPAWQNGGLFQTANGHTTVKGSLPDGILFLSWEEFSKANADFMPIFEMRNPILDQNPMYDLNTALITESNVLWVKKGVHVSLPFLHQFFVDSTEKPLAVQSKLCIYMESDAEITWIEQQFSGEHSQEIMSNYVQDIWVGERSKLTLLKDQDFGPTTTQVDQTFIFQQTDSWVDMFTFSVNAAYLRNNLHFYIDGPGVMSNLNGLYVPAEDQLMDSHTVVDHRMPHSASNELYKGVLLGNSVGVFNGKIFVRPDAQKTNAFQSCKNVLASDRATMNTKPQLEIWADDVKCSHGTTTGQLSDEALFYMRSRGISESSARTLLLLAFVQQVIDKVLNEDIRAGLSEKIINKIQNSLEFNA